MTVVEERRAGVAARAESPGAAIEITGLGKRYGSYQAVADVDLRVETGEVFALLGPNGAGKTTTVEILAGVRPRTTGSVTVLGEDPAHYSRRFRDRVGVVPQTTGAFDDLKVRELVSHFARAYSRPLPPSEVIDLVGLSAKANAVCRTLSGGQRRRVDVALALIGDPDVIFLDEPTTGLDPEVRRQAWELVRMLARRGKTTLLTTHYLDEAEALADRVGIMIGGRLVDVAPPESIGGRRQSDVVVSFRRGPALRGALPDLPGDNRVTENGDRVEIATSTPTAVTAVLTGWAAAAGLGEIDALRIDRASLEDIYLRMLADHDRLATAASA